MRSDGRAADQIRAVKIVPDFISQAEGSVLIELGKTRVICTATVDDGVPSFLKGTGKGWVTSEYGMLPRATEERTAREATRGKQSGRTLEIQRLIGRSLRAVTDQESLGEKTVWIDCDVIEADGGTRTASITGAFVALALAMERLVAAGILRTSPLLIASVNGVRFDSTRSQTSRQTNLSPALRSMAPGRSPASQRIWKPLQIPRTAPPRAANAATESMTGEKRAIAPLLK